MDLDHERLDVYHLALDFLAFASEIIEGLPRRRSHRQSHGCPTRLHADQVGAELRGLSQVRGKEPTLRPRPVASFRLAGTGTGTFTGEKDCDSRRVQARLVSEARFAFLFGPEGWSGGGSNP